MELVMKNQRREAGQPVRFEGTHRVVPGIDLLVCHCDIRFEQGQDDKCDLWIATQGPSTPQIIAFAMICSGRDDRVGERLNRPDHAKGGFAWASVRLSAGIYIPTLNFAKRAKFRMGQPAVSTL